MSEYSPLNDDEIMSFLEGEISEELKNKLSNHPELLAELSEIDTFEKWLKSHMGRPTEEQISAFVLGELEPSDHILVEICMQLDPELREEIEASRRFLQDNENTDFELFQMPDDAVMIATLMPQPTSQRLVGTFRTEDLPGFVASTDDVEILISIEKHDTVTILTGSVLADDEDLWSDCIVEVWHDATLQASTRLNNAWGFRLEIKNATEVELRLVSHTGAKLIVPNLAI